MDTKQIKAEYQMSEWAQIIRDRQGSGQSIKEFCEARGIKENAYFYWLRKIRAAACTKLSNLAEAPNSAPAGWVQISPRRQSIGALEIEIAGCHVRVNTGTDLELLKKVCLVLRTL